MLYFMRPTTPACAGYLTHWRVLPMTNDQEIRAKALEIAVQLFALLPEETRVKLLGNNPQKSVVDTAYFFDKYIKDDNR